MMMFARTLFFIFVTSLAAVGVSRAAPVSITVSKAASARVLFGAEQLAEALKAAGYAPHVGSTMAATEEHGATSIFLGTGEDPALAPFAATNKLKVPDKKSGAESFLLQTLNDHTIAIVGGADSGVFYGCLELAKRVKAEGKLPDKIQFSDGPALTLRGACIGMQKPYILPGHHVYEYPYTPELFPFFYDKAFWKEYLDYLAANRMNTLYLWNGHPFASLVKLKDYPYALEVPEDIFARNVEMYRYLTTEADKRGIWIVQMFYNIILSKPFADHNKMSTQLSAVNPLAADYTRKSIAEFVKEYPNVGLLVCLGEALQDVPQQSQWCTDVILAGVKDGMAAAGIKDEPPIIIRAHATDENVIMPAALKVYKNLYTEAKYNGESLTTWEPRGAWQERHLAMSKLGLHVANVHILANLEPFRYGAQRFIKKSVVAMRDRLGASGLHLYPLSYWNWPYAPDISEKPLAQIDRDWIWFEAWSRYAWNPDIDEAEDHNYWVERIAERYGTREAAELILSAYNDSGECAPRLLRRYGITEGNRQTLSLGMTLEQLVDPAKSRPYNELWLSQAPPGERLDEYIERESKGQPHAGETPVSIDAEVLDFSAKAVKAIDRATSHVTKNLGEFARVKNDMYCIQAMSQNYVSKVEAALWVLRYQHSGDATFLEKAEKALSESLDHYRELVRLTATTYQFANSMQTSQRRIPVSGGANGQPANYHWKQVLPTYEKEFADFHARIGLAAQGAVAKKGSAKALKPVTFIVRGPGTGTFTVEVGAKVFVDGDAKLSNVSPQLNGLLGIRIASTEAAAGHYRPIEIGLEGAASVLVGYAHTPGPDWLKVPQLETDALAGEHGGVEPLLENAATLEGVGAIDVYAFPMTAGQHPLEIRGAGKFVILGVIARE